MKMLKHALLTTTLATAMAAIPAIATAVPGGHAGSAGARDVYTDGARQAAADPFTDGARVGSRDQFTDGARAEKRDAFSDGA